MKNKRTIQIVFISLFVLYTLSALFIAKGPVWLWLIPLILLLKGHGAARGLYVGISAFDLLVYGILLLFWLPNVYRHNVVDNPSAYLILFVTRFAHALLALIATILAWNAIPSREYLERKAARTQERAKARASVQKKK